MARTKSTKCQHKTGKTTCARTNAHWLVLLPGYKRKIRACQLHVWALFDLHGHELKAWRETPLGPVPFVLKLEAGRVPTVAGWTRRFKAQAPTVRTVRVQSLGRFL